jgi:hypothetical protein
MNPFKVLRSAWRKLARAYDLRKYSPATRAVYLAHRAPRSARTVHRADQPGHRAYLVNRQSRGIASGVSSSPRCACWLFRNEVPDLQVFGPIVIEDNVIIGQNAMLFPNVHIGSNSVIGAGSVVITDVPPNSIMFGVPARPFGALEKYREKCLERWRAQRPADVVIEPGTTWWTSAHFESNRSKLRRHLLELYRAELG